MSFFWGGMIGAGGGSIGSGRCEGGILGVGTVLLIVVPVA